MGFDLPGDNLIDKQIKNIDKWSAYNSSNDERYHYMPEVNGSF